MPSWYKTWDRFVIALLIGLIIAAVWNVATATAHFKPGQHNVKHAINQAFCGKANATCVAGEQAWTIVGCETGYTYSVWANNGQYLGLFQVSSHWRRTFSGFAYTPWAQARHAKKVYDYTRGWSHWECAYRMGIL